MKRKKIILTTTACLQTLLLLGFILGIFIASNSNNRDLEFIPVFCFFAFATVQVLGTLLNFILYKKNQAKKYLKSLLWIQIVGTILICLLGMSKVNFLNEIAGGLFFFIWMFIPFFQAIWCFTFSWAYALEKEQVSEYV